MNDQSKVIDEDGNEILDPRKALAEQTLAVDLARVELDQQIATARRFPRSIDTAIKKIRTLACYNQDAAENCIYALPRGGKPIIGPSIGFASIVAQSWGNCRIAAAITYVDRKERAVIAAGRFFDLETNTETVVPVTRRIVDSRGRIYSDDMINVTGMAAASIGARNAILRGVSRGMWHPIWQEALSIVRGSVETFAEQKAKAMAAFSQFGVAPDKIFMLLGLKGDVELTLEHIPTLRGMYTQLRDGTVSVEEMFDPRRLKGGGFETVENPLGDDAVGENEAEDTAGSADAARHVHAVTAGSASSGGAKIVGAKPAATGGPGSAQVVTVTPAAVVGQSAQAATAGPAQAAPADDGPAKAAQEANPAAKPDEPTTAAEYLVHWRAVCARSTTAAQIKNVYAQERNLRKKCVPFSEEQFEQLNRIRDERLLELQEGAG